MKWLLMLLIHIPQNSKNMADFLNGLNLGKFNFQNQDSLLSQDENMFKSFRYNIDSLKNG